MTRSDGAHVRDALAAGRTHEQARWLSPTRQRRMSRERVHLDDGVTVMECLEARGGCGRWLGLAEFLIGLVPRETCNRCRGVIRKPEECPECGGTVQGPHQWNRIEKCCTTCIPNLE